MHIPALALLLALVGPADVAPVVPDSARATADSARANADSALANADSARANADSARANADSASLSLPARLTLPVSLQIESDTTPRRRRKSIEVSEWYERRLRIHRYGAYAMIPLFAFQAAAGNELYNKGSGADGWARNGHRAGATALATVFGVNTVTGLWNLWDSRAVEQGRTRRAIHTLLMLASDAGFAYAGIKLSEDAEESADARRRHRNLAYTSMGVAITGAGMMVLWRD